MSVFRGIVLSSAIAGFIVGLIITLAQQVGTAPLILRAEVYERAAEAASVHSHSELVEQEHAQAAWEPADGLERMAYSAAANVLTAIGFALLLCGTYALRGVAMSWRTGLLWGLGGFAVFVVAPGLGLPPELPGMPTADLELRQIWWIATAAATALGLFLLAFRRSALTAIVAPIVLMAPHLIGAPRPTASAMVVPAPLEREFVIAVIVTGLVFWSLLGSLTGAAYRRLAERL